MDLLELFKDNTELQTQIKQVIGDKKYNIVDDNWIPKTRFDEVNESKKNYQNLFETNKTELEKLKSFNGDIETYKKQVADLTDNQTKLQKDFELKELNLKKTTAISEWLFNSGVFDGSARKFLANNFDIEKIELDDKGSVKDFENLVKPLKENKAFSSMFGKIPVPNTDSGRAKDGDTGFISYEQFTQMNDSEKLKNYDLIKNSQKQWEK